MAFHIIRNDITKVSADAIVNTANPEPTYAGGTDYAVYTAAGAEELLREREKIGKIETGQAAFTPAFALDARYIIHTVGPAWIDGEHGEKEAVRNCYVNSLNLAAELKCESIAFPLIATGVYGFPKADALRIAVSVFSEFLSEKDMEIILVVFDEASFVLSGKIFSGVDAFIDENYVSGQLDEEYGFDSMRQGDGSSVSSEFSMAAASRPVADRLPASGRDSERRPAAGRRRRLFDNEGLLSKRDRKGSKKADTSPVDMEEFEADMMMGAHPAMKESGMETMKAPGMEAKAVINKKPGRTLEDLMAHVGETWQESLLRLIDEKGYTDTEVYKRANVDRKLFSKIRSNAQYKPKKITAVAFALALKLSLDETKDLIGRAGYAFSPSSRFDLIIEYFIEQEVYDTYTINLALFDHKQPLLGE